MSANRKQVSVFSFTQQLEPEFWLWSDDEKSKYCGDGSLILENVYDRLKKEIDIDFKFSGIVHDKDTSYEFDVKTQEKVIVPKVSHVHAVVELSNKRDLSKMAEVIGVQQQYIEIPRGRYGRENLLAYLIHAKDSSKYQYDPREVVTFDTWDYMSYYLEKIESWNYRKATTKKKANEVKVDWLVKEVQSGRLSKEQIMLTDDYAEVYADNMRLINDAFQFYAERQGFKTLEALRNKEFEMSVYYIQGQPRVGKTYFAKEFIRKLIDIRYAETGDRWRCYEAADEKVMDDYSGEEVVFLDDLRASSMNASAWLKLLDPLTSAPMSARYKNKQKATRVIVITSYLDPFTFFSYVKGVGGANEALEQFIGRLSMLAQVLRFDDGRYVSVEGIVQDDKPRHFLVGNGDEMHEDRRELANKFGFYDKDDVKSTRFFSEEIMISDFESALSFLVDDVMKKNDKSKKHVIGEKPKVGTYHRLSDSKGFGVEITE